jgi:hypothetical protein
MAKFHNEEGKDGLGGRRENIWKIIFLRVRWVRI